MREWFQGAVLKDVFKICNTFFYPCEVWHFFWWLGNKNCAICEFIWLVRLGLWACEISTKLLELLLSLGFWNRDGVWVLGWWIGWWAELQISLHSVCCASIHRLSLWLSYYHKTMYWSWDFEASTSFIYEGCLKGLWAVYSSRRTLR